MKRRLPSWFLVIGILCLASRARAETESIDLKALAKKARPAVMLLVVSDANGKEIATGTGFLVSSDGKLITNHHVIQSASSIIAKSESGSRFAVLGVLGEDGEHDLVLLKIDGKDLASLPLGSVEKVETGTRVAVVGSPLGLEGTLSEGIVSAIRELPIKGRWLQMTAAISPGSSGSPVLNAKGEVIGVATAVIREGQSLNFAIPIEVAKKLLQSSQASDKPIVLPTFAKNARNEVFSDPDFRAAQAALFFRADFAEALNRIRAVVARFPESSEAYVILGFVYQKLNFQTDTVAAFQQAVKLKPDNPYAWNGLGEAFAAQAKPQEALVAYQQAVKLQPDMVAAWIGVGWSQGVVGRLGDAVIAYEQATKLQPDNIDACFGLAWVYDRIGRHDEAVTLRDSYIESSQRTIQQKPDDVVAWSNLQIACERLGRIDKFIQYCKEVIRAGHSRMSAQIGFQMALSKLGRIPELIGFWRQEVSANPQSSDAWLQLSLVSKQYGKTGEFIQFCKHSIEHDPDNPQAWRYFASAYEDQGYTQEFFEFCNLYPKNQEALSLMGVAYYRKADYAHAVEAFQALLKIKSDHVGALVCMVQACEKQGKYDAARAAYEQLIKVQPNFPESWKKNQREQWEMMRQQEQYDPKSANEWAGRLRTDAELWQKYVQ